MVAGRKSWVKLFFLLTALLAIAQGAWADTQYTIKFNNYDGTQLQSSQVNYGATPAYTGATPTKPSTAAYTYTFNGWSPAIATVTGDATYTAQFTEQINQATVDAAIALINAIDDPVVYTTACYDEITGARTAYEALTAEQKALVDATTLQKLTDAEAAYAALEADHNAANAVIDLINAIDDPVVYTDACHQEILDARAAYNNLTQAQKALVGNYATLTDAEAAYNTLVADHAAADAVIAQINAIGSPITAASQTAIDAARNAYDNLTDDQKALVGNLSTLTNAEAALAVVNLINAIDDPVVYTTACYDEITGARTAYEALTAEQKALVDATTLQKLTDAEAAYAALEADHNAANAAIALINAIDNPVVYTTACHDEITGARTAYEALTAEQKALVDATTLQKLTDAEAAYAALEADHNAANAAIALINAIDNPVVYTTACHDEITGARTAYEALTAEQKALVDATTLQKLTDAEAAYAALEAAHTLVAVPNPSSFYEPTQIENGGFETEPTMAGEGANRIPNGTNQGWNTTDNGTQCFEWRGEKPLIYHNPSLYPIGNYCVEMNADNPATLYQDLYTNGGDVIRWSLAHAARTQYAEAEQDMRVEVGAPLYDGDNIVYPTGVKNNINTNINPDTKATYRSNGITNPTGHDYGFNGQNLENLTVKTSEANKWYYASGVYVVPESQPVTRFAFVSEDTKSPGTGNLLDDISFSTLIGDLNATYGDNNSVVIKGYWGETDPSKKLIIDNNVTTYKVDMTSVSGQNFVITMTYVNKPSEITIYHEDYVSAARTISVHYSISASAADVELVYDGNAHTISPEVTVPESGYTLKYGASYGGISLDELTYTTAGTHPIYYSVSATDYTTYKGKATLRITKAAFPTNITVTPPTPLTLDYARHNQTLAEAGSCTGYEMAYALGENGENAPTTGWSTTIPQGKQSGSYYVWYKALGGENYEDSNPAYVVATIKEPVWHTVSFTVNNSATGSLEAHSVVYSEDLNTLNNGAFALPDEWTNDATYPWVVANHTLKSGNGGKSSKTSTIQATYNFTKPGKISFSYRISSESGYDKGYFSIDNAKKIDGISGVSNGTFTANVDAGTHTFKWWYSKDSSGDKNEDAFFIDNIVICESLTDITNTTCIKGDEFELVATPKEGCRFVRWDDNSTDKNRVVTIDQDMTITAYFYAEVTLTDGEAITGLDTYKGQEIWVNYTRSFTDGKTSTVCLPFAYTKKEGDGSFYAFTNIKWVGSDWVATMTEPGTTTLTANTPYLYMPNATGVVDFSGTYAIPASIEAGTTTSGNWTFKGTYSTIEWEEAPAEPTYGFAAQDQGGIYQGEFVKVGRYVRIKPMRCYLEYNGSDNQFINARSLTRGANRGAEQLPETIKVRLVSANGDVNAIGTISTKTGEGTIDNGAWYSLDGRRIEGKPSTKGVYINNGNKVVIK